MILLQRKRVATLEPALNKTAKRLKYHHINKGKTINYYA